MPAGIITAGYLEELYKTDDVSVTTDPFYNEEHMKMLDSRIADVKADKNMREHEIIEDN